MIDALVRGLLEAGAPWGILCAVLLAATVTLWRRSIALSDKLYDLAQAQVEKDVRVHAILENLRDEIRRSL